MDTITLLDFQSIFLMCAIALYGKLARNDIECFKPGLGMHKHAPLRKYMPLGQQKRIIGQRTWHLEDSDVAEDRERLALFRFDVLKMTGRSEFSQEDEQCSLTSEQAIRIERWSVEYISTVGHDAFFLVANQKGS